MRYLFANLPKSEKRTAIQLSFTDDSRLWPKKVLTKSEELNPKQVWAKEVFPNFLH